MPLRFGKGLNCDVFVTFGRAFEGTARKPECDSLAMSDAPQPEIPPMPAQPVEPDQPPAPEVQPPQPPQPPLPPTMPSPQAQPLNDVDLGSLTDEMSREAGDSWQDAPDDERESPEIP